MKRWGFSLRKPHAKRKPLIDVAKRSEFFETMAVMLKTTPPWRVLNMDETSWKLLNHSFLTIAERGEEGILCLFEGDPKACITAIATIDAAGGKRPLWTVAKGKTERSEAKLRQECSRDIANGGLIVTHQPSGWTGCNVAMQDLHGFADTCQEPLVPLWDLYSAHRDQQLRELPQEFHIQLVLIPPVQRMSINLWTEGSSAI
jgi:hypothetical protein